MESTGVERSRTGLLKRFWSNKRIRLMLTLELAVMLPACALIVLNFLQLKSIERDKAVEAAFHREFQQMLGIAEKQLNQKAYASVERVRELFPAAGADKAEVNHQLDFILSQYPWIAHVFFFDTDDEELYFRSQPEHLSDQYLFDEHRRFEKAFAEALDRDGKGLVEMLRKKTRPVAWYPERTKRDGRYMYATTALFTMPNDDKPPTVLCGLMFDPGYLKQKFLPEMLESLVAYKLVEEGGNRVAMVVYPTIVEDEGAWGGGPSIQPIAASTGWTDGKPEVSRNLSDVFNGLTLGIKFPGTTVEAIGRGWVKRSLITLGVLSLLLVGGLVLTYRSVSKEVALARLKSDFVSNVSHELRTPLALIRLYAETLELGRIKGQGKIEEYYRIIRKESERLTALINNILDFSRIEAGRKEYEFRDTDIAELVSTTLDTYRDQIDEQGFTFEQRIEPDIPQVRVDREAIARSLVNLVNNALKYSDRDKYIGVRLYRAADAVRLEVADHGIGVARSEQSKIFEKFYRAGDPLVHNTKGSGLGLSLVRHIAHAHGGDVEVDSTPGKGSTFTLTLPLDPAAPQPAGDEMRIAG
jgi:signal transduction histidine kinase